MHEVSACDFCGGDAAGTFEVLPPEVDGGRRMVLCTDCRDTLGLVLDPLLDARTDVEPDTDVEDEYAGVEDGYAADQPTGVTDAVETDTATETAATETAATDTDASSVESPGDGPDSDAPETSSEDESAESNVDADEADGDGQTGDSAESPVPRGYRKVVRFLQNREFPLDRTEAVSMVSDAYGMERKAVETAIDYAIDNGRFDCENGQIST